MMNKGEGRIAAVVSSGDFPVEINELISAYRTAAGFPGMSSKRFILQSMVLALLGGDETSWRRALEIVFKDKPEAMTVKSGARSILAGLSPMILDWILRKIIVGDATAQGSARSEMIPRSVIDEVTSISSKVYPKLKEADRVDTFENQLRVYLTIHYDPDTWQNRWKMKPNHWTLNPDVVETITKIMSARKTISPQLRAFLIASAL